MEWIERALTLPSGILALIVGAIGFLVGKHVEYAKLKLERERFEADMTAKHIQQMKDSAEFAWEDRERFKGLYKESKENGGLAEHAASRIQAGIEQAGLISRSHENNVSAPNSTDATQPTTALGLDAFVQVGIIVASQRAVQAATIASWKDRLRNFISSRGCTPPNSLEYKSVKSLGMDPAANSIAAGFCMVIAELENQISTTRALGLCTLLCVLQAVTETDLSAKEIPDMLRAAAIAHGASPSEIPTTATGIFEMVAKWSPAVTADITHSTRSQNP